MIKVALIGTAGRNSTNSKIDRKLYFRMIKDAQAQIQQLTLPGDRHLVSGGAAIADHLAVSLYLMNLADSLTLYFPCKWDPVAVRFDDSNKAGQTANYYHSLFSNKMGGCTLSGIDKAIKKGAAYHEIEDGFKARNLLVGDTDILICYHWNGADATSPPPGGSLHTWKNSTAKTKVYRALEKI